MEAGPATSRALFVFNDAPYGSERTYNGLRLARSLASRDGEDVRVFLMGDAAPCAKTGQNVPRGYYNVEVMLRGLAREGSEIGVCGTCMDARGISDDELAEGCRRSSLDELTEWTRSADRVLTF